VVITAYPKRLNTENAAQLISPYDLIIDGSDNFPTRYLVNDTCVALNKPLIFGSILKFEGQVSVFNYRGGPDYRDVFPEAPPDDEVPNCSEIGVIGVLPGIIGTYMVNEAIKIICGIGETLSGRLLIINTLNNSTNIFNIAKQTPIVSNPLLMVNDDKTVPFDVEITIETLKQWQYQSPDDVYLVDVREDFEFEDHNIGGVNISLYDVMNHVDTFPANKKLVFVCQSGQRSKMAVKLVQPLFKGEVFSIKNGIV
jgi:adenylyltransferase/sulfurtransferase